MKLSALFRGDAAAAILLSVFVFWRVYEPIVKEA
jgi:hypothetical protein